MANADAREIHHSDNVAELKNALATAIESFPDFFFVLDYDEDDSDRANFRVDMANQKACDVLGSSIEDIRGRSLHELGPFPDLLAVLGPKLLESLKSPQPVDFELGNSPFEEDGKSDRRLRARCTSDRNRLFLSMTRVPTGPSTGSVPAHAHDFELLVESMSDVVLRLDTAGVVEWSSPSAATLFGRADQEPVGQTVVNFIHHDFSRTVQAAIAAAAAGTEKRDFLLRIVQHGGSTKWVRCSARPVRTPDNRITGVVLSLRDVDAEVKAKTQLDDLAMRDPLTGLGTRAALVERLAEELKEPGPRLAVIEMHIDHLGRLNDAISFSGADQVIATIAERLHSHLGAHGDAFRLAGGEFGILLRETATISQAVVMAERLRTVCGQPISIGEYRVIPYFSVGVAFAREADPNKHLYDAHRAMRTAKLRGGNQSAIADDRGGLEETRWLIDEAELTDALREGRYNAFFQPIVTLPEGVLAGFEVLVRCRQQDGRVSLPPGHMAVAEATGLIKEIDRLVLRQALNVLRRLDGRQFISVNVSVRSLADPSYLQWVETSVQEAAIEPSRVHLEVTESTALAVPPSVRLAMERLAAAGFTWYLDDFGTGYSSLSSLRDLPMGGLKLDCSFTAALLANRDRVQNLTQGMVRLADEMGLVTVAEGVEKQDEADLLAAQGWKFGQGWLFGRAMSAEEAQRLAISGRTLPATPASG